MSAGLVIYQIVVQVLQICRRQRGRVVGGGGGVVVVGMGTGRFSTTRCC